MMDTELYKGHVIEIHADLAAEAPLNDLDTEPALRLVMWHRDVINPSKGEIDGLDEARAYAEAHGALAIRVEYSSHGPMSHYALTTRAAAFERDDVLGMGDGVLLVLPEYWEDCGLDPVAADDHDELKRLFGWVAEDYTTWANGGVEGFVIRSASGETVGSGWGFYDRDTLLEEARADVDNHLRTPLFPEVI